MNRFFTLFAAIGCFVLLFADVSARNPVVTKLHPQPEDVTRERYNFGTSVAVNENWIVVSAVDFGPTAALAPGAGAVYVFSARTGRLIRKIQPSTDLFGGLTGSAFGSSLALCGNRLLVGAPFFVGNSTLSAALLYDLPSGRLRKVIRLEDPSQQSRFGRAVALSDQWIVVGEEHDDEFGRAHVFHARTGAFEQLGDFAFTLEASDSFESSEYGFSLALCEDILAVGAYDSDLTTPGAVYIYDLDEGGTELRKIVPSDGVAGDWFGRQLAMDGGRLLVGAEYHGQEDGATYLYDVGTGNLIRKLMAPNPIGGEHFGATLALSGNLALIVGNKTYLMDVQTGDVIRELSVADNVSSFFPDTVSLCGNLAVVGNKLDDDINTDSGAAYFFRPLAGPLPLTTLTQRGNSVGTRYPETEYRAFQSPAIDPTGDVSFCANLSGPGSAGGRDKVIAYSFFQQIYPRHKTGDSVSFFGPGVVIQNFRPPIQNRAGRFIHQQFLRGPGINAFNRQLIRGVSGSLVLRTGDPISALTGTPEALAFTEVVQKPGNTGDHLLGVAYRLRRNVGGVSATNDSGVFMVQDDRSVLGDKEAREGNAAIFGTTYAQFFGRVAQGNWEWYAYSAYVVPNGGGRPLQQCFTNNEGNSNNLLNVAKQGDDAPLATGPPAEEEVKFRSILGEGLTGDFGLVRARIVRSNPGNRFRNEGIWREDQNQAYLIKGEEFDRPGTFVQRILRFWPVGNNNVVVLVKLFGPSVNPGNDCALAITEDAGFGFNLQKLVREGDAVCDWDCPRIRTIQRVDVDPENGNYAVVVALTGSPRRNQALLTGNANLAHPNNPSPQFGDFTTLRRANLVLRKGTLYNTPHAEATRLRSIVLEPRIDRTGSGGKGLGQVINENGEIVLCLQFDDGAKELVVGKP